MAGNLVRLSVTCLTMAAMAVTVAPPDASAQAHRVPAGVDSLRQIQSMTPVSGPAGTKVVLSSENLPLQAKIHVGIGSVGAGFETIGEAWQGEWGDVEATVQIPRNATWERPVFLLAFNAVFAPIGISDPFHVTDANGEVRRTGVVAREGGGCLMLHDQDDQVYALLGELSGLAEGDKVVLQGGYAASGSCGEMSTLTVSRIVGRQRGG